MPQPITHYLVIQKVMERKKKSSWDEYKNFAGFGSFGPDLFYMKDAIEDVFQSLTGLPKLAKRVGWTNLFDNYTVVADIMHWEGSFHYFCEMLNFIKRKANDEKLKSFAYGYYSHVITDTIFHPYVYRFSKDHWKLHNEVKNKKDKNNYLEHKRLETDIDWCMAKEIAAKDSYQFAYHKKINCYESGKDNILDKDLVEMIYPCMKKAYKNRITRKTARKSFYQYIFNYDLHKSDHPINDAYNDFIWIISYLYEKECIRKAKNPAIKVQIPKEVENKTKILNTGKDVWSFSNKELRYSVWELFDLAVKSMEQVIDVSEDFLNSGYNYAREFFQTISKTPIFLKDFNLDTGLPSTLNKNEDHLSENHETRFGYETPKLVAQYKQV